MHLQVPAPGSTVWIRQRRWRVERARLDRHVLRIDVASRDGRLTFLAPFDRVVSADRSPRLRYVRPQGAIARVAGLLAQSGSMRIPFAAVPADVAILAHQLEPVLAILDGARRVLVADEVGLGKTIQAALVIAELHRRAESLRTLVICPASLCHQWRTELADRFRLAAEIADRRALEHSAQRIRSGDNPWRHPGVWIASPDYLKQPHVADGMPLVPWDVVVIDEAHEACGDSDRHASSHEMAARARHVVLLTATPHSGDHARFARLQQLGAIGRTADEDTLRVFRRTRAGLAMPPTRRVRWHRVHLHAAHRDLMNGLRAFERTVLLHAGQSRRDAALLLLSLFRKRALSTVHALDVSIRRRCSWIEGLEGFDRSEEPDWIQARLDFGEGSDDLDDAERTALIAPVGLDARKERLWLRRLQALAHAAAPVDGKLARLQKLASRARDPIVIFTEFRHSLQAIEERLAPARRVTVLHGGQSPTERQRSLARFIDRDADVLVATDVASQGLNLQSRARWVVSLEVPWNPARLEQRIGRVDRLGQTRAVHATVLLARHEMEAALLQHMARRVVAARRAVALNVLPHVTIPNDAALRSAILTDQQLEIVSIAEPVPLCARYERRARALARVLNNRRQLQDRWRGRFDASSGPHWTARRRRQPGPARPQTIFVFAIPLVDGIGTLLERRVVAVQTSAAGPDHDTRAAIDRAKQVAVTALGSRRARVERMARVVAGRRLVTERALLNRLRSIGYPEEAQAGLFDRAALRTFAANRGEASLLGDALEAAVDEVRSRGQVQIGRPELFLVIRNPR